MEIVIAIFIISVTAALLDIIDRQLQINKLKRESPKVENEESERIIFRCVECGEFFYEPDILKYKDISTTEEVNDLACPHCKSISLEFYTNFDSIEHIKSCMPNPVYYTLE